MATALVTGASSGLGAEFAWQLGKAGHDVVLVARDHARLGEVADEVRNGAGVQAEVLVADLGVRKDLDKVVARLRDDKRPVGLLVNNAGFGMGEPFITSEIALQENALDVMVRAVMVLSHAAAGAMVARGRGAVLNVSSIASSIARGSYSAHKAWVVTFTEALATELKGTGVTATVTRPGLVRTEFQERAGMDLSSLPEAVWIEAEAVVAASLAAVRRGQVVVTPSVRYAVGSSIAKVIPRSLLRRITSR